MTGASKASFVGANMVSRRAVLLRAGPSPFACTQANKMYLDENSNAKALLHFPAVLHLQLRPPMAQRTGQELTLKHLVMPPSNPSVRSTCVLLRHSSAKYSMHACMLV